MIPALSTSQCAGSKVILLGEHAVVHGVDALVVGLPQGVCVTAQPAEAFSIEIPAWSAVASPDLGTPPPPAATQSSAMTPTLHHALAQLLSGLGAPPIPMAFRVDARIPSRAGMGASASLGVALARATCALLHIDCTPEQLFSAVLAFENVFHHNSSGVDIHAVSSPGCGIYNRHTGYQPLKVDPPALLVVHSGSPGATKDTVLQFEKQLRAHPDGPQQLNQLRTLVARGAFALQHADWTTLGAVMNETHQVLSWFGVSTPALDQICHIAQDAGAAGAKLTGGGGGGCAVILPGDRISKDALRNRLTTAGFEVIV